MTAMEDANAAMDYQNSCDRCPVEFGCGKIKTAMTLLEAMAKNGKLTAETEQLLAEVKAELAEWGWSYPTGKSYCELVSDQETMKEVTVRLIALLNNRNL